MKNPEKVVKLYREGSGVTEISKKTGYSRAQIYNILKKNAIKFDKHAAFSDITGNVYGYLKVVKMAKTSKSKGGRWRAICTCSNCGNSFYDADPQAIKRGFTTSCGCRRDQYQKNTGKNNKNFSGFEDIRGTTWTRIKEHANRRQIDFNLSIEDAWELFVSQNKKCAISGVPIVFGRSARSLKETTASLDRIDSKLPYERDNVHWVHKDINIMKNIFGMEYFVNLCRAVACNNREVKEASSLRELLDMKVGFFGHERNKLCNR